MSSKGDGWFRDCLNEHLLRKKNGDYDRTSYDLYMDKIRKRQAEYERNKVNKAKKLNFKVKKIKPIKNKIHWLNSQFYGSMIVFLQIFPSAETEGMVWWIFIVTVIATMLVALFKSAIGSFIQQFIVKKDETKKEVRKFSMIFFVFLVGVILVFASIPIGVFLNKDSSEISIVGVFVILISILIAGLNYRKGAKRTVDRIKRRKTDEENR